MSSGPKRLKLRPCELTEPTKTSGYTGGNNRRVQCILTRKTSFTAALVTAVLGASYAHTLGATGSSFVEDLGHPFGGFDHLLAMVTVGLWAVQAGGRAMWAVGGNVQRDKAWTPR